MNQQGKFMPVQALAEEIKGLVATTCNNSSFHNPPMSVQVPAASPIASFSPTPQSPLSNFNLLESKTQSALNVFHHFFTSIYKFLFLCDIGKGKLLLWLLLSLSIKAYSIKSRIQISLKEQLKTLNGKLSRNSISTYAISMVS